MNFLNRSFRVTLCVPIKRNRVKIVRNDHTIEASEMELPKINKINVKVGFIGDGNMAKAICNGMVKKGMINYSQVVVSSPYIKNLDIWKNLGAKVTINNNDVVEETDAIVLAVKPHLLPLALSTIDSKSAKTDNKLYISILAGILIETLEKRLSKFKGSRVMRVMPNTPMMVGRGCSVYAPGKNITKEDIILVRQIFETSGIAQMVPENMINAVGALSGSGPAFVYLMIEAMSDGGVRMGLHRAMATKFAAQTVLGAAKMVLEQGKHTGELKDEVCSAGGTTIAGMHALERGAVRGSIMNAIEAAALKAEDLAKSN